MPLGDRQENDLVHITLDVWQDKVYYLGKEYPAGYFAAGVLNASDDLIVNTAGSMIGFALAGPVSCLLPTRQELDTVSFQRGASISFTRRVFAFLADMA